jgi:mono/diheme cytochrome c family protein
MSPVRKPLHGLVFTLMALGMTACHRKMSVEPKFLPDQQNYYFSGEQVDRPPVAHTVPRGRMDDGLLLNTGASNNVAATTFPVPVTLDLVRHGQEAFNISCAACHGRDGYGEGIVVQRGFPKPSSFHSQRLRDASVGYFFQVIKQGSGVMYPFGNRISPSERWAIIAYIRALQFSQRAPLAQLESTDTEQLDHVK